MLLIAEPEISRVDLKADLKDDDALFVLLACDGLWDVFGNQEACHLLAQELDANGGDCSAALDVLTHAATELRGSTDNVTATLVLLKPWAPPLAEEEAAAEANAKAKEAKAEAPAEGSALSGQPAAAQIGDETSGAAPVGMNEKPPLPSDQEAMVALYEAENPTKVAEVDGLLVKYAGKEAKMWASLAKKYGDGAVNKARGTANEGAPPFFDDTTATPSTPGIPPPSAAGPPTSDNPATSEADPEPADARPPAPRNTDPSTFQERDVRTISTLLMRGSVKYDLAMLQAVEGPRARDNSAQAASSGPEPFHYAPIERPAHKELAATNGPEKKSWVATELQGMVQALLSGDRVRLASAKGTKGCRAAIAAIAAQTPTQRHRDERRVQRQSGLASSGAASLAMDRLVLPRVAAVVVQAVARAFLARAKCAKLRAAPGRVAGVGLDPEVAAAASRLEKRIAESSLGSGSMGAHLKSQVSALRRHAATLPEIADPLAAASQRAFCAKAARSLEAQLEMLEGMRAR